MTNYKKPYLKKRFEEAALAAKGKAFYMQLSRDDVKELKDAYSDFFEFCLSDRICLLRGDNWYNIIPYPSEN